MPKRIVKSCPTVVANGTPYRAEYEVSVGLIEVISNDTRDSTQRDLKYLTYSRDVVLEMLIEGQPIKVLNPFGTEVIWTLEDVP